MRQSRPLLPIRPLDLPARLGRRQRRHIPVFTDATLRVEQHHIAAVRASRPVWLHGPLFRSTSSSAASGARHAG